MEHVKKNILIGPPSDTVLAGIVSAVSHAMTADGGPPAVDADAIRKADTWAKNVRRGVGLRESAAVAALHAGYDALLKVTCNGLPASAKSLEALRVMAAALAEVEGDDPSASAATAPPILVIAYVDAGPPVVRAIPNTLEAMQTLVGGFIQQVHVQNGLSLICDEDGKSKKLPVVNHAGAAFVTHDVIRGPFFVCRTAGDDFSSVTDADVIAYGARVER